MALQALISFWALRALPARAAHVKRWTSHTMRYVRILVVITLAAIVSVASAQDYGVYVGTVKTEWLSDGRQMRLLAPFAYIDPRGHKWQAPTGSIIDGASIPKLAWSFAGGPFEGKYRDASVIHDVACDRKDQPWEAVHEAFYWAMLASQVEVWRAKVMYTAVYQRGPRWPREVTVRDIPIVQSSIAKQKALEQAEPGSTVEIRSVRPYGPPAPTSVRKAEFRILIRPPAKAQGEYDLEKLSGQIQERESTLGGGFTLAELRALQP